MSYPRGAVVEGHPDGVVVTVWVAPRSKRTGVDGVHDGALRVRVAAPPEGGRANDEAGGLLRTATGARNVSLLSGAASRRKRILLEGVDVDEVRAALGLDR